MAKAKLAHVTNWEERNIEDWNATTFRSFFRDMHDKHIGIPYEPFRSWAVEMSMYKQAYTKYGKPTIRLFIENEVRRYKPSSNYPGTSFGFLYSYMKSELQQAAVTIQRTADRERMAASEPEIEDFEW